METSLARLAWAIIAMVAVSLALPGAAAAARSDPPLSTVILASGGQLPPGAVHDLAHDRSGNLWIATDGGLISWNGADPRAAEAMPPSTSTPTVTSIATDRSGRLWVAAGTLLSLDRGSGRVAEFDIAADQVVVANEWGWALTRGRAVRFSLETGQPLETIDVMAERTDGAPTQPGVDAGGALLVPGDAGAVRVSPGGTTERIVIDGGGIGVVRSGRGHMWIVSESGLWELRSDQRVATPVAAFSDANTPGRLSGAVVERSDRVVVLGTSLGRLVTWDPATDVWSQPAGAADIAPVASGLVTAIVESETGGLWLATDSSGVHHIGVERRALWPIAPPGAGREPLAVSALVRSGNSLWIGTDARGLFRAEASGEFGVTGNIRAGGGAGLPSDVVTAIAVSDDQLWVGTGGGGLVVGDRSGTRFRPTSGSNPRFIGALVADGRGTVWAGVRGHGVQGFDRRGRVWVSYGPGALVNRHVEAMAIDGRTLWAGGRAGLDRIDLRTGRVVPIPGTRPELLPGGVSDIFVGGERSVWLATPRGLVNLDPVTGTVVNYAVSRDPARSQVFQIGRIPASANLWLSTGGGLVTFDTGRRRFVRDFGRSVQEPLAARRISGSVTLESGLTLIGAAGGFIALDPSAGRGVPPSGIAIEAVVEGSGTPLALDRIGLREGFGRLSIDFNERPFDRVDAAFLEYRLLGADRQWTPAGGRLRRVVYDGLAAGSYRFEVRSVGAGPASIAPTAVLAIEVQGPWWQQTWVTVAGLIAVGLIAVALPMTRVWQVHRRAENLEREVAARTAELRDVHESKLRLMSAVSHDLSSPIMSVLMSTDMLDAQTELGEDARRWVHSARAASLRMRTMVGELRDLASYGGREIPLRIREVNLHQLVGDIVEQCSAEVGEADPERPAASISLDIDERISSGYRTDRERLERTLTNLISNALIHGGGAPVAVEVCLLTMHELPLHTVRFTVSDSGPGIDPEFIDAIFEPFQRGSSGSSKGLGLGLAISQQFLRRLSSRLHASSPPEGGARFWFDLELPVVEAAPQEAQMGAVLCIEDDVETRQLLEDQFSVLGLSADVVATGDEALAAFANRDYRLVLTDHRLESELGSEVAERLRALPGGGSVVFVALTGNPEEAGACAIYDEVVVKPVGVLGLRMLMRRLMAPKPADSSAGTLV